MDGLLRVCRRNSISETNVCFRASSKLPKSSKLKKKRISATFQTHSDGGKPRPRLLTFGYGEQVAEVGASLVRRRRLEAPDLPQYELVVCGQSRQAQEVVALLALQGGAGHAAVQHLEGTVCDWVSVRLRGVLRQRDGAGQQDGSCVCAAGVMDETLRRDSALFVLAGPGGGSEGRGAMKRHEGRKCGRRGGGGRGVFTAANPFLQRCASVSICITDGRASVGRAR